MWRGDGYAECSTCGGDGKVPSTCTGIFIDAPEHSYGGASVCGVCGATYSYGGTAVKCNVCGRWGIASSGQGGNNPNQENNNASCHTGSGNSSEYVKGKACSLYETTCPTCSGNVQIACTSCSQYGQVTRTCTNCNGSYTSAKCSYCTGGKAQGVVTANCIRSKMTTTAQEQIRSQSSSTGGSVTYGYYATCAGCHATVWIENTQGGGMNISNYSYWYIYDERGGTQLASVYDGSAVGDTAWSEITHSVNGGTCYACKGDGVSYCTQCRNGVQYRSTLCSKISGNYYTSTGASAQQLCNKVVTGLSAKK